MAATYALPPRPAPLDTRFYHPEYDCKREIWLVIELAAEQPVLRCESLPEARTQANALNADVRAQRAASEGVSR